MNAALWTQKLLHSPWPYRLLRWGLAAVFVYAGATKLLDPRGFAVILSRYDMVPPALLPWAALGLPALEVAAGLGLAAEVRGSLSLITGLLIVFAGVLWFGVLQGLEIDCGCFAGEELAEHDSLRTALRRDLIMLAAAAYLYWWRWRQRRRRAPNPWRLVWQTHNRKVEA
ncbi:MAG: MauE/DoxX family redox-associated membrane protein [Thermodesulfobacteriota bacterium]